MVLGLARDPVPNVRFTVARTWEQLMPLIAPEYRDVYVIPCLRRLGQDSDVDVEYYASRCLKSLSV